jgi:hypothetical protein
VVGCNTLSKKIKKLELGMTPDQVREQAGSPYAIRAAKVYDDGRTEEVWEYLSRYALYPKDYWVFFENGKVVQWGEPGDFSGLTSLTGEVPVKDYTPVKKAQ